METTKVNITGSIDEIQEIIDQIDRAMDLIEEAYKKNYPTQKEWFDSKVFNVIETLDNLIVNFSDQINDYANRRSNHSQIQSVS